MEPRKKAQDIFNETDFLFSKKTTFEKAFPEVRNIVVNVTETGDGLYRGERNHHYTKSTIGEYINCSNRSCYNGGFRIGDILRDMILSRENDRKGTDVCQGNEASQKGRRIYRKCLNEFSFTIHIDYVENNGIPDEKNSPKC
jgi:hypothetical protein